MMVPAHDQRDHDFAKKFAIPVISVIAPDIIGAGDIAPRSDVETLHRRVMDAIIENDKGEILLIKDTHWHFV
jgi:leucyl-tRNA synthetase